MPAALVRVPLPGAKEGPQRSRGWLRLGTKVIACFLLCAPAAGSRGTPPPLLPSKQRRRRVHRRLHRWLHDERVREEEKRGGKVEEAMSFQQLPSRLVSMQSFQYSFTRVGVVFFISWAAHYQLSMWQGLPAGRLFTDAAVCYSCAIILDLCAVRKKINRQASTPR